MEGTVPQKGLTFLTHGVVTQPLTTVLHVNLRVVVVVLRSLVVEKNFEAKIDSSNLRRFFSPQRDWREEFCEKNLSTAEPRTYLGSTGCALLHAGQWDILKAAGKKCDRTG